MKNLIYLSVLVLFGCYPSHDIYLEGKKFDVYCPINTQKISENFYADETIVANIDYKEYLYWLEIVYGYESNEYLEALPDTTVWKTHEYYGGTDLSIYFRHPSYNYYPVVGVTLNQAKKYTDWRTEVIVEMRLISKGLIKASYDRDSNNHFTINRYLTGDYDWIIKKESFLVPRYKIPTIEEWEKIAGIDSKFKYGTDSLTRYNRKVLKEYKCLFNTDDFPETEKDNYYADVIGTAPYSIRSLSKNIYGLYGIIGNVAELVEEENTVKGGSWQHKISDISISKNELHEKPNSWVGFRNVCTFELMKIDENEHKIKQP